MSNSKPTKTTFTDALIIGGLTIAILSLLPLIAVLGLAFQFVFVAAAPVALLGTITYALITRAEPVIAVICGIQLPENVWFWRGHSWARRLSGKRVLVGVDDFAQRLIGLPERIESVPVGKTVQAGDVLAVVVRRGRTIGVTAPISGVVTKVNSALAEQPSIMNSSPYERGWFAEIEPVRKPFTGLKRRAKAVRWIRTEVDRLVTLMQEGSAVTALPDGGELVADVSAAVDERTWQRLVTTFLESPAE